MTGNKQKVQREALHFFIKRGSVELRFVQSLGASLHEFPFHTPLHGLFFDSVLSLLVFSVRAVAQKSIEFSRYRCCKGSGKRFR